MSILREFFVKLGLDMDEAGFASALTTVEGLKWGLEKIGEVAQWAGGQLRDQFTASVDEADKLSKVTQIAGVAADRLQQFAYAGDLAGVSLDEITAAATFMARKGVKDVNTELLRLADLFQGMPDGADKTRIAAERLGRAVGPQMIPLLNGGREALEELFAEAPIRSKESLKAAEEFNDTWTKIQYVLRGVRDSIVDELVPVFQPFVTAILDFVKANREVIKQRVGSVLTGIGKAFRFVYVYGIRPLVTALEFLAKNWKTIAALSAGVIIPMLWAQVAAMLSTLSMGILPLIAGYVMLGITAVITAVKAAIAWLAVAWPFILIAIAIAGVILVLEDLYTFLQGGDSVIGRVVNSWKSMFSSFGEFMHYLWEWIKSGFFAVWDPIWDRIKKLGNVFGSIKDMFSMSAVPAGAMPYVAGAAGPAASVANSPSSKAAAGTKVVAPSFSAKIDVHAAPGMDEKQVGMQVQQAMQDFHDSRMREANEGAQ